MRLLNLKDTLKAFDDFKNKQKSVFTFFGQKKQKTKQNKKAKTKHGTKIFFLRAPTNQSFTFILRFLYVLKCKVHLSKTLGFSIFNFVLIKV